LDGKVDAWRVSDPTSLPRLGVAASLSPVLYGRGEAGAHYQLTERWTAGLGYLFEGAQIYDGKSAPGFAHSPSVEAWYRATRITDLGMEVRFQQFLFGSESSTATSASLTARHHFTRQVHGSIRGGAGTYSAPGTAMAAARPYPRVQLELGREGERLDLAVVLGHDLMGASGFTTALWADYGSTVLEWRALESLAVFGAASVFRNGKAPDLGFWPPGAAGTSQGYALAAGLEWKLNKAVALKLQGDRYAQIGAAAPGAVDLARNVVSARVVVTPLDWAQGRGW
jgi:opacity protein-like surface antigen